MADDARAQLREDLGPELDVLDLMSDDECAELLELFHDARKFERAELQRSIDEALKALPWLLRAPAKLIMFPKGAS